MHKAILTAIDQMKPHLTNDMNQKVSLCLHLCSIYLLYSQVLYTSAILFHWYLTDAAALQGYSQYSIDTKYEGWKGVKGKQKCLAFSTGIAPTIPSNLSRK